ncbi:MAG: hypothetical protein RIR64_385 [Bacteroidota bacterium]
MAGYLHHTAQPSILAAFLPWGVSTGAGCARPAVANIAKKLLPILPRIDSAKTNDMLMSCAWRLIINKN